jgi:hypothetical protein
VWGWDWLCPRTSLPPVETPQHHAQDRPDSGAVEASLAGGVPDQDDSDSRLAAALEAIADRPLAERTARLHELHDEVRAMLEDSGAEPGAS